MSTLVQVRQRLKPLRTKARVYKIALQISKRFEAYLIDLNQIQLSRGVGIFGESLGTYAEATESFAEGENTRQSKTAGDNYNFEWTGALFDGMYIRFTSQHFEIFSRGATTPLVIDKFSDIFGEQVLLGLTKESLSEYVNDKLIPEMQNEICRQLEII